MSKILLIEDNISELQLTADFLRKKHDVVIATSLNEAREKMAFFAPLKNSLSTSASTSAPVTSSATTPANSIKNHHHPFSQKFDLLITDRLLPDGDGLELVEELHEDNFWLPILVLTGLGEGRERISGLKAGADDYLAKPFEPEELMLRINNLLAKEKIASSEILTWGGISYQPQLNKVTIAGESFFLSNQENQLWNSLFRHRGQVITRQDLMLIWEKNGHRPGMRTIDVTLRRLRSALGDFGTVAIKSVHGLGYQLLPLQQ